MKPFLFAPSLVAAFLITSAVPSIGAEQATSRSIDVGTSYQVRSVVLDSARQVNVWLPSGYNASNDRYPVVYLLDGATDQDFNHIVGLGSLASLSWTFGPFIIVGIQTRERRAELTPRPVDPRYVSAFPESGGAERFRHFLRDEVIPFVTTRYRTNDRRAIMGESLAGLFVIDTLLTEPTMFSDYIAISPSLWWDDRRMIRDRPIGLPSGTSGKKLFLAIADEGGTMQDGVNRLRKWLAALPTGQVETKYADYSLTATHSTVYHHAAENALRWLFPAPPYDAGPTPWFMIDGAAPPTAK